MSGEGGASTNESERTIVCYAPTMITTNGVWQGDNPLDYSLPLFILQLMLVVITTRILVLLLRPFRQPRVIAEILGGVILGPSVLGRVDTFATSVFPLRSVMVLETMANIGLLYFLFLVGVEMDMAVLKRTGRKAIAIAVGGMILPFITGCAFSLILQKKTEETQWTLVLFLGVTLAVTAFPVLARILAELKLLSTDLGKIAMSAALINDIFAWVLLAVAIALAETNKSTLASLWVVLSSVVFVVICIFVVRPGIMWIIQKTPEGENFSDFYICLILTGVMISGFITDAIGTHSVFGAFVFGLIIPNGRLGITLIEKLEDFVSGLLLPLFFAISGLKTNVNAVSGGHIWIAFFILIVLGCLGKVAGTAAVAYMFKMPLNEGITLGLLMNTKGLVEMIVLNVGKDQKVLNDEAFSLMVMTAVIMTGIITPIVTGIYRPVRKIVPYKRRTLQSTKPDTELRLIACVHTPRNVPTIINLIEATNPSQFSPVFIYVLHLVELTGRTSAMLIVHNTRKSGQPTLNQTQAQSDHVITAFESFEQSADGWVTVQPITAISPYNSMHEDICTLAEEKRMAFIILPFHKHLTVDGGMEATNPSIRSVNQNVLTHAPCSVGILVDRGLSGSTRLSGNEVTHNVALLFFGGPDDREALAFVTRMYNHPGIGVTILRFIPGHEIASSNQQHTPPPPDNNDHNTNNNPQTLTVITDVTREKHLDDDYINQFREKTTGDESISYREVIVNNGEETVAAIRSIDTAHDLFIVGRGQGVTSPLTAGLTDWSECPELGPIGDVLASSDFASTISVLVVQQYAGPIPEDDDEDDDISETPTAEIENHREDQYAITHSRSIARSQSNQMSRSRSIFNP